MCPLRHLPAARPSVLRRHRPLVLQLRRLRITARRIFLVRGPYVNIHHSTLAVQTMDDRNAQCPLPPGPTRARTHLAAAARCFAPTSRSNSPRVRAALPGVRSVAPVGFVILCDGFGIPPAGEVPNRTRTPVLAGTGRNQRCSRCPVAVVNRWQDGGVRQTGPCVARTCGRRGTDGLHASRRGRRTGGRLPAGLCGQHISVSMAGTPARWGDGSNRYRTGANQSFQHYYDGEP